MFVCLFQVLTEEDWNNVMYTSIRSQGGRHGGGLIYGFYFVFLTLCGNYCLLNVFLAIACDSLDQAAQLTAAEEAERERQEEDAEKARQAEAALANGGLVNGDAGHDDEEGGGAMQEDEEGAVRPILPYSSLFILSSTNP